jgi:hypothetical protein
VTASLGAENLVRYTVLPADSWLTFEARSTLHPVHGKATQLDGFIDANWNATGLPAGTPPPRMHVEFPVEQLRSGNGVQDREMWKVVDSKRFPRVSADLRELHGRSEPGRYAASGDVTLAGRSRRYEGELSFAHEGDVVTVEGALSIDIRDFGLKPPNLLIVKVDPVVKVHLHLVARQG